MASIGRYEIEREIGRGSMGIVYLAHDPHVRRRVAIKTFLLPPGLTSQQEREYSARFLREAQAAGSLSHPSIVTIFDADTDPERGLPFIVMEFVEGGSLRDLMIRDQRLEPDRALAMVSSLADALRVAHEEGVVHRDIKPANVLLRSRNGQAKIVDFGVARMSTSELTGAGDVFGSPAYMSPEQFRGEAVDARSDLFSLATILYQTLCGERPFAGDDMSSLAYSVVHTPAPPISRRMPGCPPEMDRFFEKALAKNPADRFPDAAAFQDAVDHLRRTLTQQTVALSAHEARRIFALPPLAGPLFASLGRSAQEVMDRVRRAMAPPAGPASSGNEKAPAELSAAGPSGISGLEGALALTMLVLAVLPGLWALWSPASPRAAARGLEQVRGAASGRVEGAEPAPGSAQRSSSPAGDRNRASARSTAKTTTGAMGAPVPAVGRKKKPAMPGSASSKTPAAPVARTALTTPSVTDAARARSTWAPKGAPAPAAETPASIQDGAGASLAAPMSREPLTRRPLEAPRPTGFVVIEVRSLVKSGTVRILVDGREVSHRRLSSVDGEGAQPKKIFHRREETFSMRFEVPPGSHTVAAQVFNDGKDEGREDSEKVTVQAHETTRLHLVAGRIIGASVSLKQD